MILTMNDLPPLSLHEVYVERGNKWALENLCLDFPAASITALVGPNGSGKTTLLEVLAGLRKPTKGTITHLPDSISLVTQHHENPWMPLTVAEVVRMGRYQKKLLPNRLSPADHDHVEQALEKLDISALAGHPISELSGGQRQRAFIAQALARDASLLLLDEPITGLDFSSQEIIMRVIEQTRQAGGTVVLSTHHLDEARHADQVAVLATTLVAAGAPDAVLCPDVLRQAYGARLLGDHSEHDHRHEMLLIDDHGHGHHEN